MRSVGRGARRWYSRKALEGALGWWASSYKPLLGCGQDVGVSFQVPGGAESAISAGNIPENSTMDLEADSVDVSDRYPRSHSPLVLRLSRQTAEIRKPTTESESLSLRLRV